MKSRDGQSAAYAGTRLIRVGRLLDMLLVFLVVLLPLAAVLCLCISLGMYSWPIVKTLLRLWYKLLARANAYQDATDQMQRNTKVG